MENDYKNVIQHIDIDRSVGSFELFSFEGIDSQQVMEFKDDILSNNDSIETHLAISKSYKESLVLRLKKPYDGSANAWHSFLKEDQKTFGGSKIFYINSDCTKLLVLAMPNEIKNKLNMVVSRLNKINERISRLNSKIKKDNLDLYSARAKNKEINKSKEEIVNFINHNFKASGN